MNDGPVAHMRPFLQPHCYARKHMDGAVLLYITPIFYDDPAPVSPDRSTRPYIYILPDGHIPRNGCLAMNESCRVDHGPDTLKLIYHIRRLFDCLLPLE